MQCACSITWFLEAIKGWIGSIKCMVYVCVVLVKHHIFGKMLSHYTTLNQSHSPGKSRQIVVT